MTAFYEDSQERIDRLLLGSEALFRKKFLETVEQIQDEKTIDEIILLLEDGNIDEALAVVAIAASNFGFAYSTSYTQSANSTADFINSTLDVLISFDQTNTSAVDEMRANQLRLVTNFTQGQIEATKSALLQGVEAGLNPRQQALLFRQSIGLTENQITWVMNYRRLLEEGSKDVFDRVLRDRRFDSTILNAINNDEPLSSKQIDRIVERYRERVLIYRSETIARTESLSAVHQGVDNMYFQAIDSGVLDETNMQQTWHTSPPEKRIRDSHKSMDGQVRKMGEAFESGAGNYLRYPGDPEAPVAERVDCRCMKTTRFKVLTG